MRRYFEERRDGRGIWKWRHYFDIYERHFRKFRGRDVHVLEIGVYSGGSLEMWRDYFGPASTIYGVDIEPACRAYENQHTRIFIGDQGDRAFWRSVRADAPLLDIVIDDGSHRSEDQIVSLEELLAHLRPGGVYVCEDLHSGTPNPFISFVAGLAHSLNAATEVKRVNIEYGTPWSGLVSRPTEFQRAIASIHLYPFVAVIERSEETVAEFVAPRHGTEWQPFYE